MEKNFDRELNQLHVSVGSFCTYFIFSGLYVENDGCLNKGEFEIVPLSVSIGSQSTP